MVKKSTKLLFMATLLMAATFLFGFTAAPDLETIKSGALMVANVDPDLYEAVEFEITNDYTRTIDGEEFYVYETVYKIKERKTGEILDGSYTQTPDGVMQSTFGLVKRGKKWYPMQ